MKIKVLTISKNDIIIILYKNTKGLCTNKKRKVGEVRNNIKRIRMTENISQKQLAKHLRVTQQAVSYMENTEANIPIKKMKKIANFLQRDIEEVFPELKDAKSG